MLWKVLIANIHQATVQRLDASARAALKHACPTARKLWAMSESDGSAGTQPLSQRTHLGRSSKAAAQKKLHEVSDEEAEDGDDDDDAASSGSQHCNVLQPPHAQLCIPVTSIHCICLGGAVIGASHTCAGDDGSDSSSDT
jgi:hypothetical protein